MVNKMKFTLLYYHKNLILDNPTLNPYTTVYQKGKTKLIEGPSVPSIVFLTTTPPNHLQTILVMDFLHQ